MAVTATEAELRAAFHAADAAYDKALEDRRTIDIDDHAALYDADMKIEELRVAAEAACDRMEGRDPVTGVEL